jgi:hypothetical protein
MIADMSGEKYQNNLSASSQTQGQTPSQPETFCNGEETKMIMDFA